MILIFDEESVERLRRVLPPRFAADIHPWFGAPNSENRPGCALEAAAGPGLAERAEVAAKVLH